MSNLWKGVQKTFDLSESNQTFLFLFLETSLTGSNPCRPKIEWATRLIILEWNFFFFYMDHKVKQAWKCNLDLNAFTRWAASIRGASPCASLSSLLPCSGGTEYLQIKRQRWKCRNQNTAKHHQSRMKSDFIWKYGTGNKEQDKEKWVFEGRCNISLAPSTDHFKKMNRSI